MNLLRNCLFKAYYNPRLLAFSNLSLNRWDHSPRIKFYSTFTEPSALPKLEKRKRSRFAIVNWLYDDIFKGRAKMNAFFLYAQITNDVNYLEFFRIAKLDDTFNSWFLVTELHVWMMMSRLRGDGKLGMAASSSLVAAMWDDTSARAKALSPGDNSTSKKQIQILGLEFKASLLLYDEGLLGSDVVLASALWYRLLSKSCDDPRLLELLTAYVRAQMYNLDCTSQEDLLVKGVVKLKPLPVELLNNIS